MSGKKLFGGAICFLLFLSAAASLSQTNLTDKAPASPRLLIAPSSYEYLWYEAENMRGLTETSRHEPLLNPSYLNLPANREPPT